MLLVCVHFDEKKSKLCYDLNSYYWRVVMIIEYNMIIMIMIVKAVIKKHTCKMLLKELFTVSPPHTDRRSQVSGCDDREYEN